MWPRPGFMWIPAVQTQVATLAPQAHLATKPVPQRNILLFIFPPSNDPHRFMHKNSVTFEK